MRDIISAQIKNTVNIFLNRYFSAIALVVAVIILISGYLFLVRPKYKQIVNDIESAGEEESLNYSKRQKYLSQLKELKAEYRKISQEDIEKIKIMLPGTNNREELLAQMEKIITKNGFLLTSLSVEDIEPRQEKIAIPAKSKTADNKNLIKPAAKISVNKVKINMNIIGTDYSGLKKLLDVIENNLRLIDITNLSFSPNGNTTSLEMYAYYAN